LARSGYHAQVAESIAHARRAGLDEIALAIVAPAGFGLEQAAAVEELRAAVGRVLIVAPSGARAASSDFIDPSDEVGLLVGISQALAPKPLQETAEPTIEFEGYRLDLGGHSLMNPAGKEVRLRPAEFSLLRALAQRPGRVLSRDQLLQLTAGRDAEPYERSVDIQIMRLRRKIEPDPERPILIVTVPGSGYKFAAPAREAGLAEHATRGSKVIPRADTADKSSKTDEALEPGRSEVAQTIKYCRASDGVRIAYATSGSGPPLVKAANWMNHLEYDWESPIWRHVFSGLSREHTLIRYDARGNGMSEWNVDNLSVDAWVTDLETVVDAVGVKRFPLLGISQGGAVAVAYAVRNPDRVSHLILYGAFALGGRKRAPDEKKMRDAMATLMRLGWGRDNPSFRQMFTGLFIPGGTHEQEEFFNELQRKTASPEGAARYFDAAGDIDITELLSKVTPPTLVMHVRDDQLVPFEAGRQLAASIPGARFVALPGRNHLFLEHEAASDRFFEEIDLFLRG
jgi:pimeloyl-ACP methyl ester carboxylesterase/DNA-binding response OmpR family regulator